MSEEYLEQQASLFPLLMEEMQKGMFSVGPQPTDPEVLARIDAPALLLRGQRTKLSAWFTSSADHLRQHLARMLDHEIPGVGHFAPMLAPDLVARELLSFFESA